jgi:hypothetical protein
VIQQMFVFTKSCHSSLIIFFTLFTETDIDVCTTAFTISFYSLRKRLNLISFLSKV